MHSPHDNARLNFRATYAQAPHTAHSHPPSNMTRQTPNHPAHVIVWAGRWKKYLGGRGLTHIVGGERGTGIRLRHVEPPRTLWLGLKGTDTQ